MRPPVAPYLTVSPALAAITFYTTVFGACEIAWNKDPAFGVICIQSGPLGCGSTVASWNLGGRDWNAGCGNNRQNSPGVFRSEEVDQGDLPGPARVSEGRTEDCPLGCDRVPLRTLDTAASQNRAMAGSARLRSPVIAARVVCGSQPVASTRAASVAPLSFVSIATMSACFEPDRGSRRWAD
jgi:hypothetical protein